MLFCCKRLVFKGYFFSAHQLFVKMLIYQHHSTGGQVLDLETAVKDGILGGVGGGGGGGGGGWVS
ncbi:hypothetical protein Hanom_Chr15g01347961 [Helianthus anomalus]